MLPQPHRLKVQETRGRRGKRTRRGPLSITRYAATTPRARCAIVITGKGAVQRNRLRRRIAGVLLSLLPALPAQDAALYASLEALEMDTASLRAEIAALFSLTP